MILPGCQCCAPNSPCYGGRQSLLVTIQGFAPQHVGYGLTSSTNWLAEAAGWGRNPRTINGTYRLLLDDGSVCRWIACLPTPNRRSAALAGANEQQGFNITLDGGSLPVVTIGDDSPVFYAQSQTAPGESLPQQFTLAYGSVTVTIEADDGRPLPNDTTTSIAGYIACGCPAPASPWFLSDKSLDPSCIGGDGVVCYSRSNTSIPDVELDLAVVGIRADIDAALTRRYSLRRGGTSGTLFLSEAYDGEDGVGWFTQVRLNASTGAVSSTGNLSVYLSITPMAGEPWESVYNPMYPTWTRNKSNPTVCDGTKNRYAIQVEITFWTGQLAFFTMAEFFTNQCFNRLCNGVRPFIVERTHTHGWPHPGVSGGLILPGPTIQLTVERS